MNIAISIKTLRERIVSAINESQLPPSVLEPVLNAIYQQIAVAARDEVEAALKAESENTEEVQDNG